MFIILLIDCTLSINKIIPTSDPVCCNIYIEYIYTDSLIYYIDTINIIYFDYFHLCRLKIF